MSDLAISYLPSSRSAVPSSSRRCFADFPAHRRGGPSGPAAQDACLARADMGGVPIAIAYLASCLLIYLFNPAAASGWKFDYRSFVRLAPAVAIWSFSRGFSTTSSA